MRRGEFGLYVMIVSCLGFGLVGLFLSYFHDSTVCDSSGCHPHAAGTIEPMTFVISGVFFLLGVYLVVRALRRPRVSGSASVETRLEVSAAEQAKVAREARANFTKPSSRLYNQAKPSEFDRQMLSLLDSIEAGAADIDAKIELLRYHVRHEGLFQGWKDKFKANMVWQRGAAKLQWVPRTPETWQLRCNWNRLLRIVGSTWGSEHTIAPRWIAPEIGQPAVATI
jgi:hypothetical protein